MYIIVTYIRRVYNEKECIMSIDDINIDNSSLRIKYIVRKEKKYTVLSTNCYKI